MTDIQLITLVVSIVVAVVFPISMLLYSNSKITEAKETLRAEIGKGSAEIRTDLTKESTAIHLTLLRMENKLDHVIDTQASQSIRLDSLEKGQG